MLLFRSLQFYCCHIAVLLISLVFGGCVALEGKTLRKLLGWYSFEIVVHHSDVVSLISLTSPGGACRRTDVPMKGDAHTFTATWTTLSSCKPTSKCTWRERSTGSGSSSSRKMCVHVFHETIENFGEENMQNLT